MQHIYEFLGGPDLDHAANLTILEIGCAHGEDSYKLYRLFPNARLFCFEPDPRNLYALAKSGFGNAVTIVEAAVGDRDGEAVFNLSDGKVHPDTSVRTWTFSSSLKKPTAHLKYWPEVKFQRSAKVKVVRLDTFRREHKLDRIDFIWADVQGAEDLVIAGGQETLANTRYFYTECYDTPMYDGQIGLEEIHRRLPGGPEAWEIMCRFPTDVLLKNTRLSNG